VTPPVPSPAARLLQRLDAGRHADDTLATLDGAFAAAWWDGTHERLTLLRDPFGVRSLYYTVHQGTFYFASELKQLLAIPGLPVELDLLAVHKYLTFSFVPGEDVPVRGVRRLLADRTFDWEGNRLDVRPYFILDERLDPELNDRVKAVRFIRRHCRDAVARRLNGEPEVSLYLSGGVDSSGVAWWLKQAGVKMQVMQNYRYLGTTLTLRQVLRGGDLGRVNYVMARFAADYREWLAWGAEFRHTMRHALLLEGAVHHFDQIRNLSGGDCQYIGGWEWNPAWSTSKGEFNNLYVLRMTNGVHACYEGSGTAGGEQNTWHEESYRVECQAGAVTVGRDKAVRIHRFKRGGGLKTEEVPLVKPAHAGHSPIVDQGHAWIVAEFLDWLDGGPAPATTLEDNIRTAATIFGAIEAARTGQTVDVQQMVAVLSHLDEDA